MKALSLIIFSTLIAWSATARAASPLSQNELPTTNGAIAVGNLGAQIDGEEKLAVDRPFSVVQQAAIAELHGMRGQFLGVIAEYDRAEAISDRRVATAPEDGRAYLARARSRGTFHLFEQSLADLDRAQSLGVGTNHTDGPRAAVLQALGRYDEALLLRQRAVASKRDIRSLTAEAVLRAERGEIDTAEKLFTEAQHHYRDVAPFPVAWLYFQQGQMWMREGNLPRARELFTAAHERLPQYAAAQGHLAEVEAALGNSSRAVELLRPLAAASDDPDYAAQLARILGGAASDADEARRWRAVAASRYDQLLARHPEAFADHAAEFWLAAGNDPAKALLLAQKNLSLRPTARAYELVLEAALAAQDTDAVCSAAVGVRALPHRWPSLQALSDQAGC